jgi:general secretion pathway protein F
MTDFRYKAMTASGAIIKGRIAAASEAVVIRHLRNEGHFPLSTVRDNGSDFLGGLGRRLRLTDTVSSRRLSVITQEFSDLLLAGLELDRVLGVISNLREAGSLRQNLIAVRARVRDGAMLADAFGADSTFPKFYVSMVRAGELGSVLAPTLRKLADYMARTLAVREAVLSALVYPAILLVTAGLSVSFILAFVLPSFEPLFASAGRALPLPTQIALGLSDAFRDYWWLGMSLTAGAGWWFKRKLENTQFRRKWHAFVLRLPLMGRLLADIELERFKRILGTLLGSGVPVPTALGLAQEVLWNTEIAAAIKDAALSLREGETLARKLGQSTFFPSATLDLIQIGEETGRLDEMLIRQADFDEQRIRHQVDRLIALLVPGLTIILGVVVAGLIASMLVAILSVNDLALQ